MAGGLGRCCRRKVGKVCDVQYAAFYGGWNYLAGNGCCLEMNGPSILEAAEEALDLAPPRKFCNNPAMIVLYINQEEDVVEVEP